MVISCHPCYHHDGQLNGSDVAVPVAARLTATASADRRCQSPGHLQEPQGDRGVAAGARGRPGRSVGARRGDPQGEAAGTGRRRRGHPGRAPWCRTLRSICSSSTRLSWCNWSSTVATVEAPMPCSRATRHRQNSSSSRRLMASLPTPSSAWRTVPGASAAVINKPSALRRRRSHLPGGAARPGRRRNQRPTRQLR